MSSNKLLATLFAAVFIVSLALSSSTAFAEDAISKSTKLNYEGVKYYKAGDYAKAIKTFNKILKFPDLNEPPDSHILHGVTFTADYKSIALTNLGAVYIKLNDYDTALECFNNVIERNPTYTDAWNLRGVLYFKQSDYDNALQDFRKAFELNPNAPSVRNNLAFLYQETNNLNAKDWEKLGNGCYDAEDYDKAIECYKKAMESAPLSAFALHNLGTTYYNLGNYDVAIEYYNKILEAFPTNAVILHNLGTVYYKAEDYGKAIEFFDKALELSPDNLTWWKDIGFAYYETKDYDKATKCLEKSLQADSEDPDLYNKLADSYEAAGDANKATEFRSKAKKFPTIKTSFEDLQAKIRQNTIDMFKRGVDSTQIKENLT